VTDLNSAPCLDAEWLDTQYDNRKRVSRFPQYLAGWEARSRDAIEGKHGDSVLLDVPYGGAGSDRCDVFRARPRAPEDAAASPGCRSTGAPVLVFVHGGYWRSLDKKDFSFIGPAFAREGACVVIPNYALCPGTDNKPVRVPDVTLQLVRLLVWIHHNIGKHGGDPSRITLAGHSAGGHLAAMLLTCVWKAVARDLPARLVKNALSISGLFELESIRQTPYLEVDLRLTPAHALQASPAWLPNPKLSGGRGVLYSVVGADESAEFLRHNSLIQKAWGKKTVPTCEVLPGLNHFSILDALVQPGHRLNSLALELLTN
jgi:arylformamidase